MIDLLLGPITNIPFLGHIGPTSRTCRWKEKTLIIIMTFELEEEKHFTVIFRGILQRKSVTAVNAYFAYKYYNIYCSFAVGYTILSMHRAISC